MKTHYIAENTKENLSNLLNELARDTNVRSVMLFLADISEETYASYGSLFESFSKPLVGGVFPGLLSASKKVDKGALVFGLDVAFTTHLIPLNSASQIASAIEGSIAKEKLSLHTVFTLIDAFADNKSEFMQSLYDSLGNQVTYLGGGCGSLDMVRKPCLISNSGITENSALLCFIPDKLNVGCAHGWKEISDPLKITEAKGNNVISIDWRPAFEVYKELIGAHSGLKINTDNFFSIAKSYPFGMAKIDSEYVVRDPITTDGSAIFIVDEIPVDEFVYLLHGNEDLLINGAKEAAERANLRKGKTTLCIDCISRVLFLEDRFQLELDAITSEPINGFLAIGEIANSGGSYLEIYNKTVVVTQL
jgi:hypothetical protein